MLLFTVVAIEFGGWFLLRVVRGGQAATEFQKAFFRAGYAHAGALVKLSLVGLVLVEVAHVSGLQAVLARNGIWLATILMSAQRGVTQPNRLVVVLNVGMAWFARGVVSLGLGLLTG